MRYAVAMVLLCAGCDLLGGGRDGGDARVPENIQLDAGAMLAAHNQVRADASPTPSPALPDLTWSDAAAAVAEAWAERCTWAHNPGRGAYGENLFANTQSITEAQVVEGWASEVAHYDLAANQCAPDEVCGHYTQLVWRETLAVGCARRTCTTGSPFTDPTWELWVCDYSPPGNTVGQSPY